jgi:hypothetical protein
MALVIVFPWIERMRDWAFDWRPADQFRLCMKKRRAAFTQRGVGA